MNNKKEKKIEKIFLDLKLIECEFKKPSGYFPYKPGKKIYPSKKEVDNGGFIESSGLSYSKKGLFDENGKMISSHMPYIKEKYYECNENETIAKIVFGFHYSDTLLNDVPMSKISNKNYLANHIAHNTFIYDTSALAASIKMLSSKVKLNYHYTYTGFPEDMFYYVHSGGVIAAEKFDNICAKPYGGDMTLENAKAEPTEIVQTIDDILKLNDCTALMLAFNVLSLTYSKYKSDIPQFVFLLVGLSGTFKSSISRHIFSIFKEYYQNAPVNIKVTSLASLHRIYPMFRDCICLLDDAAPSVDGNAETISKCESITRAIGDSSGRMIVGKNGNLNKSAPRGLCAVTAEFVPLRDTSDIGRCVMYKLSKGDISKKSLTNVQNNKRQYIRFIIDYITWICEKKDKYINKLDKVHIRYRKKLDKYSKMHNRMPDNLSWLYAGFYMICEFCKEYYNVSEKKIKKWRMIFKSGIKNAIKVQREYMQERREDKLFIDAVNKLVISKQVDIAKINISANNKKNADIKKNTIGYCDENYVYLLPDESYGVTNKYLNSFDSGYALPLLALQNLLKEQGVVKSGSDGRTCSRVTINGNRIRVLKIKKEHFCFKS